MWALRHGDFDLVSLFFAELKAVHDCSKNLRELKKTWLLLKAKTCPNTKINVFRTLSNMIELSSEKS